MHSEEFNLRVLPLRNKLFRFAFMMINNRSEAEDIVQEVMMKLWLKKDTLNEITNLEAWSMAITKNLSFDLLRRIKRQHSSGIESLNDNIKTESHELSIEHNEEMNYIKKFIGLLNERQQHLVFLRDIEGHSYSEISKITGLNEGIIKITLFRARESLRKNILKIENYGL